MIDFGLLHRVPLVDDSKTVLGVLAQSDVVRWALTFLEKDENSLGNKAVRDTTMGVEKTVVQIHKRQTLKEAFTKIKETGVTGIAVTSDMGSLYGNISATDVKMIGMTQDMFMRFNQTVEEFLGTVPPNQAFGLNPIFIRPSDSVKILAKKFVESGVHRIYLVGDMFKILGVISLIDFIMFLVNEAKSNSN